MFPFSAFIVSPFFSVYFHPNLAFTFRKLIYSNEDRVDGSFFVIFFFSVSEEFVFFR